LIITPVIYLYLDKYSGTGPMEIPAEMLKDWDFILLFVLN
jgi:HAE1 family hydrophobic/amphiphilic exporter-1